MLSRVNPKILLEILFRYFIYDNKSKNSLFRVFPILRSVFVSRKFFYFTLNLGSGRLRFQHKKGNARRRREFLCLHSSTCNWENLHSTYVRELILLYPPMRVWTSRLTSPTILLWSVRFMLPSDRNYN